MEKQGEEEGFRPDDDISMEMLINAYGRQDRRPALTDSPAAARSLPPEGKLQSPRQLSWGGEGVPWDEAGVQLLSAKATPHSPALVSSEFPGSPDIRENKRKCRTSEGKILLHSMMRFGIISPGFLIIGF
ncbi:hypothetical protein E5288_WYG020491 [Bos mutus]|uniref:Uncharacterized protein n=1 Tax=Bos mutus TaxID=72004 RepID=A0A6B0S480_9CETA|nr:hypothetical protein [Bos mutus]